MDDGAMLKRANLPSVEEQEEGEKTKDPTTARKSRRFLPHLDEVAVASKLEEFRKQQPHFVGLSFPAISSTGGNGAIIHYSPEKDSCAQICVDDLFLIDSGAHYLDGTTDTTRTLWLPPTTGDGERQKRASFRELHQAAGVLQGRRFPFLYLPVDVRFEVRIRLPDGTPSEISFPFHREYDNLSSKY